ncbi:MAG: ABC transporter permease [Gemmatimonadota bacterium]
MPARTRGDRVFRALLNVALPKWFRVRHEQELVDVFSALRAEARGLALVRVWLRELASLARLAWELRVAGRLRAPFARASYLDVKLGLRMLVKDPGLTVVAVFALAIAIPAGLVPAHFTHAIEAPLPVEEGERVRSLRLHDRASVGERPLPIESFDEWRTSLTTFGELAVTTIRSEFNVVSERGTAAPATGALLTASSFDVLRVEPVLGRSLTDADEIPGSPDVVVVSFDFWQDRLDGSPDVLGRTLRIGGVPHTLVGVMPDGFRFPLRSMFWVPLRPDYLRGEQGGYIVFGRLADGSTLEEARAEVSTRYRRAESTRLEADPRGLVEPEIVTFAESYFGLPDGGFGAVFPYRIVQMLALLLLAVGCTNVGMLVFARTAGRASELAVRTALGASRLRVLTQLFTEALVFAVVAAGLGLVIGDRVAVLFGWMTDMLPYWVNLRVQPVTALWALGLAGLSAAFVSIVPALRLTSRNVQQNLQRSAAGRSGVKFGGVSSAVIVVDVMLAVVVLGFAVGGTDLLTERTDTLGIEADQYLHVSVRIPRAGPNGTAGTDEEYVQRAGQSLEEIVRRIAAEPDVRAVAAADVLPGMDHLGASVEIEGVESTARWYSVHHAHVAPNYFRAFGQTLREGRDFSTVDATGDQDVVIVNQRFVDQVLGGRNAIGQRIRDRGRNGGDPGPWLQIVGVVGSLGMNEAMPTADAGFYVPRSLSGLSTVRLAVHLGEDPTDFTPRLREVVAEVDPSAIVIGSTALSDVFSFNRVTVEWAGIGMATVIAILIALSASGIFALMSFTIVRRTREIGIRLALGAKSSDVTGTIVRRSMAQLTLGVLLGLPLAWRLLYELKRDLGRIPEHSPFVLAVSSGVFVVGVIGLLACVVPLRRALRIEPTEALREG